MTTAPSNVNFEVKILSLVKVPRNIERCYHYLQFSRFASYISYLVYSSRKFLTQVHICTCILVNKKDGFNW